ncbi:MAG: response regulator transcription factor [Thermoguttaceae bacterium]|nr:response regulator transcription factor [Thermoguttaceae bacterium]
MGAEKILIVEDDASIREILSLLLETRGFSGVEAVGTGTAALERASETAFDLVLLDLTLPDVDGLDVCRRLRSTPLNATTPTIMLTARGEETDVVVGLEAGAVDYVVKPFNNQTLLARIRAQLRRTQELASVDGGAPNGLNGANGESADAPPKPDVERDGLSVFVAERLVLRSDGASLDLTPTEFDLLVLLMKAPGRIWSRYEIAQKIRGDDYIAFDRAIDVQIANLRKKLGPASGCVETARGVGYRWKR